MKTYVTYGFFLALGGLLLNVLLYLTGFHSTVDKWVAAQWIGGIAGLALGIVLIVLGIKARRAEVPLTEEFSYGWALGAGVLVSLFSCLFGIVTNFLYTHFINTGFQELIIQVQTTKWEAAGMSSERIEQAEKMMRSPLGSILNVVFVFLFIMFINTVISLIAAAFLKRAAVEDLSVPPVAGAA